jgi:hypothetical protein
MGPGQRFLRPGLNSACSRRREGLLLKRHFRNRPVVDYELEGANRLIFSKPGVSLKARG